MKNNSILIISGAVLITAVAFYIYKKAKSSDVDNATHSLNEALDRINNLPEPE